jgi:hypothetical protein
MNFTMVSRRSKWSVYGALFTAIAVTAVWFTGTPAYASSDMCTPDECHSACVNSCATHGCGALINVLGCNEPSVGFAECYCSSHNNLLCDEPQCS